MQHTEIGVQKKFGVKQKFVFYGRYTDILSHEKIIYGHSILTFTQKDNRCCSHSYSMSCNQKHNLGGWFEVSK